MHAVLKVSGGSEALTSTFEVVIPAGYDVGAHVHTRGEELFYIVEGELDLLAMEPVERSGDDWHDWVSETGQRFMRGGPGSLMFVPAGCPHAFANPSGRPATMLFQSAPEGHEFYFDELAEFLRASDGPLDQVELTRIRVRHDIQQLTPLRTGSAPVGPGQPADNPA